MFCVSFVLMKIKSQFNFKFAFNEHSLKRLSLKNTHILVFAVISYCFKYLCLFSVKDCQINPEIKNICEKNLSVAYAKDTMLRDVRLNDYF